MQSLEATYVEKFQCDGASCNAKCCRNWGIFIDAIAYSKYTDIKPALKAKEITKHIKKKGNLYSIKLTKDKNCPFIDENQLCHIQKNYGESYLSAICRTYPRIIFLVEEGFCARSLTLSCPVACHLALSTERPIKFHTVELPDNLNIAFNDARKLKKGYMLPLLQVTGANILQAENLSIDQRLAVLALFMESADKATNSEELADISEAFEKEVLKSAKDLLAPLHFDRRAFLKEMFTAIRALFTGSGANDEAILYANFINKTFDLLPISDDNKVVNMKELDLKTLDLDKLESLYLERFIPAKKALLQNYSLQVENFLVHYFLQSGQPIKNGLGQFIGSISKFIFEYKLAEFVFICFNYSLGEKFHEVAIELAVMDFVNLLEHDVDVSKELDDKFKNATEVIPTIQLMLDLR